VQQERGQAEQDDAFQMGVRKEEIELELRIQAVGQNRLRKRAGERERQLDRGERYQAPAVAQRIDDRCRACQICADLDAVEKLKALQADNDASEHPSDHRDSHREAGQDDGQLHGSDQTRRDFEEPIDPERNDCSHQDGQDPRQAEEEQSC
jgi:hypothetical protein